MDIATGWATKNHAAQPNMLLAAVGSQAGTDGGGAWLKLNIPMLAPGVGDGLGAGTFNEMLMVGGALRLPFLLPR